jgi:polyhydroxyalkanoate synthesis regulator phasin
MANMKKKSVLLAVGSALVGGLGVGVASITTMAQADTRLAQEITTDSTVATGDSGAVGAEPKKGRRGHLESALNPLVQDGTITQTQADKVIDAIVAAAPMRGGMKGRMPLEVVAGALGISKETLRSELDGTKSIADIAKARGVDVQKVIDALVADATKRIDEAVTAGKLTAAQAATAKSTLTERITERVNKVGPAGRGGHGRHGRHGGRHDHGGDQAPAGGDTDGTGSTGSSSGISFV